MMLCVYTNTGFHVLRTEYLYGDELASAVAHYESMGYVVDAIA
jgi:hypothetical protein